MVPPHISLKRIEMAARPSGSTVRKGIAMKWLLIIGALAAFSSLSGCCQPGGLFSGSGGYGAYSPAPYYSTPATTYANPCNCQ